MRIYFAATICMVLLGLEGRTQVRMEIFGGPQLTTARYLVNGISQPTDFKLGIMAGVGAKVTVDNNFFFFPTVYYSLKGYKVTLNNPSFPPTELAKNNNLSVHTIEFAPLFQFDLTKKPDYWFIRVGPSVDYAFFGTEKFDTINGNGTVKRDLVFDYTVYGHITASLNLQVGYQMQKGLGFFAHYSYGVGSMNNSDGGPQILHRIAGVSVSWMFGEIHPKPKTRMPRFQYMK
jgi:hypothetical protein